ncbi:MAG: hypothetical protein ETSY1_10490 [Candidatus Entotheonella factor]|uniref:AB hydrolase-1 domain-containing protein n=1 Tax=Entotheonella factor TaxID=1429438 RepID=W4LRE7_ENTF1|nr:MAG: hypothetical protein ETSY1_10490 [Candidatus Entotheonella factor]
MVRVSPPQRSASEMEMFPAGTERHVVPQAVHFMPREQPQAVVEALLKLVEQDS